jgi:hypothetical protein
MRRESVATLRVHPLDAAWGLRGVRVKGGKSREHHHDLEEVRAVLGHARIDTTQIYASIRPPQLKRAVSFDEERAVKMLSECSAH